MNSCNRVIVSVLLLLAGCGTEAPDLTTATIQNVGLVQTAGVPPLGEGVAPIIGRGGDGSPVLVADTSWSTAPGAVKVHGGQLLVPYSGTPGALLQNVACDVKPRADATDTIELVGPAGVLGTTTVPATTANVIIRAWIVLSTPRLVADGDIFVMRHSPRDAATGAWTSAAQDMTVISCAANAATTKTLSIPLSSPFVTTSAPSASLPLATSASTAVVPFSLPIGSTITATRAVVHDNTAGPTTLKVGLLTIDGPGTGAAIASNFGPASAGTGAVQAITSTPIATVVQSGRWYAVEVIYATGTASASVAGAEVDYLP